MVVWVVCALSGIAVRFLANTVDDGFRGADTVTWGSGSVAS